MKKIISPILFIILLILAGSYQAFACTCDNDLELIQEMHNTLVQKKMTGANQTDYLQDNDVVLFQTTLTVRSATIMPSTGDVKILVLPIEFNDEKFGDEIYERLEKHFFDKQDIDNTAYKDLSVCDYFKKVSFNKLRLTGRVLPVHSASEDREYYLGRDEDDISFLTREIVKAIQLNKDTIGDLTEYDSDNDGYIDCLHVVWAGPSGSTTSPWWGKIHGGGRLELYDNIKLAQFSGVPEISGTSGSTQHEMGHLMGLPDNYAGANGTPCVIPVLCYDLMAGGYYVNAYYKYLLDWEEPLILPYEDATREIELFASDVYSEKNINQQRAVMFIPDSSALPLTELYIAEYRSVIDYYKAYPGIILWHINIKPRQDGLTGAVITKDYIKPVYKSGDESGGVNSYKASDLYKAGDEFSNDTTPSSKFYNDVYTGAYMKVVSMDDEKATILAGFREPDLTPAPTITISPPSKKAVKSGEKVTYTVTYENAEIIDDVFSFFTINSTNTAKASRSMPAPQGNIRKLELERIKGEGTLGITIKAQSAYNIGDFGAKRYAPAATSEIFYVDNTPPEIVLQGENEITLEYGAPYVELGAEITDNLDPDIESKLRINSSKVNTNKAGTYQVYYNAVDHAGNAAAQVIRTVTVLDPPPPPEDKIELTKITSKIYLAKLIFEKTVPAPLSEEIRLVLVCKDGGRVRHSEMYEISPAMTTAFYIPPKYKDCDIELYVWDINMRPLMSPRNLK